MQALWHWLKTQWREHQAVTGEAPTHRTPLRSSTPGHGMTAADYLRLLIETRPWP
jgi:hypothetical protein